MYIYNIIHFLIKFVLFLVYFLEVFVNFAALLPICIPVMFFVPPLHGHGKQQTNYDCKQDIGLKFSLLGHKLWGRLS